ARGGGPRRHLGRPAPHRPAGVARGRQAGPAAVLGSRGVRRRGGTFAHDVAVFDAQGYSGDLSLGIAVHSGIVPHYIVKYGSEEQKRQWLPPMATGEVLSAIGMTEPGAG